MIYFKPRNLLHKNWKILDSSLKNNGGRNKKKNILKD